MSEYDRYDTGILGFLNIFYELCIVAKELIVTCRNLLMFVLDNFVCLLCMLALLVYSINDYADVFVKGFKLTFGL